MDARPVILSGLGFLAGLALAARGLMWIGDTGGPRLAAWWTSRHSR